VNVSVPLATSVFLSVVGVTFLFGAGLPLLVAPDRWGRWFGWEVAGGDPYRAYLGRCLGAVASVLCVLALLAAPEPAEHAEKLRVLLAALGALLAVHVVGALRGRQPWGENAEIGMYVALLLVGGWLYVGRGT
jgi:hypothetical protein